MAKAPVLGNDPFQRGAAAHPEADPDIAPAPAPAPARAAAPKKGKKAKPAQPAKKTRKPEKTARPPRPEPAHDAAPETIEPDAAIPADEPEIASDEPAPEAEPVTSSEPVAEPEPEAEQPAAEPSAAPVAGLQTRTILHGELVDAIPERAEPPPPASPPPGWLDHARLTVTTLANQAMQTALSSPWTQRALEKVMGSPVTHQVAGAAERARETLAGLASAETVQGVLTTAAEAGAALHQVLRRSEPSTGEVDPFGEDPSTLSRSEPLLDFLHDRYFRVEALEPGRVPAGACLLVCNHSGVLPVDGPMVRTVLRRECRRDDARWLVEDAIFHAPVMGTLLNRLGAVRACPENAERLLQSGVPLAVFPEGLLGVSKRFDHRYQLQRFGRGGFVKLALRAGVPIVPVAVVGAEEASPLLARLPLKAFGLPYLPLTPLVPLPTKWTVSFLEPVAVDAWKPEDAEDPALVARLTGEVREAIQDELQRLVAARRSVLGG